MKFGITLMALAAMGVAQAQAQVVVDKDLPKYEKSKDAVSGTIKSVGSDTMNNLMALWGEGFRAQYPNVQIEIEGKGSATAPPALIKGTSTFGPMSREMKAAEEAEFQSAFGYKPTKLPTSLDTLAVFVHKDNPLAKTGLSLQQVDAIFSKTRKRGGEKDVATWGDLGLTGKWKDQPISLYGRNSASGTYGFFKEHALSNGDFKATVKEQPGTSTVVQAVAADEYGIGYGGIGYVTSDVKALALDPKSGTKYVSPSAEHAYDGTYPMWRFLYLYVNYKPGSDLDPLRREFLKYIMSQEGQKVVVKDGYLPIPASVVEEALAEVNLAKPKKVSAVAPTEKK